MKATLRSNSNSRKDTQSQGKSTSRNFWASQVNEQQLGGDDEENDENDNIWSGKGSIQYSVDGETPAGSALHAARRTSGNNNSRMN